MTSFLLDTHTLIWYLSDPSKLAQRARKVLDKVAKTGKLLVSSISVWEIFMLLKKDKFELDSDPDTWLGRVENTKYLEFIPIDNAVASKSVMLPEPFHKDPADRIIIATAREYGAILVTSDKKILKYPHVQTLAA